MKFFYTPQSPYARIARVVAAEAGLDDRITLVEASLRNPDGPPKIGQITLACTLGWCDTRHTGCDWRTGRPNLVAWFEQFEKRPSMLSTLPPAL